MYIFYIYTWISFPVLELCYTRIFFYEKPSKLHLATTSFTFYADQVWTHIVPTLLSISCQSMWKCDPHGTLLFYFLLSSTVYIYMYNIPRHHSRVSLKRSWLLIVYIIVYISHVYRQCCIYIVCIRLSANIPGILPINAAYKLHNLA